MLDYQQQTTKTILIVEDDPAIGAMLTQMILQETPYQVVLAREGTQALHLFREVHPDLMILNYRLPCMTGIDLYDQLQDSHEIDNIPTMMVSANLPGGELKERGIIGVNKPFDIGEILDTIENLLK